MDLRLPEGASFAATEREVERMEGLLKGDPNIVNYVAYVGGNTPRFYLPLDQQLNQINIAQIVILTKDNKAREAVNDRLQKVLADQFTGLRGRINRLENGPPVGYPIQFRVSGKDPNLVRHYAEEVAAVMRRNPHALNVNLDWNERTKVIKLNIDQNKARAIGINSQDLSAVLNAILVGYDITEYRERDKLIKVVARAPANERVDVADLGDITVPTSSGKYIPLAQIAKPSYEFEDGIIWRRQRLPTITVRSDIFGDIQAPVVTAQINPELDPIRAKLPEGYYIEVGGATEDSAKAGASIAAVMPLMVLAIITVLMIQLQSLQRTFLVLLTAPLGLIGVVAVLLVWNVAFGFVSTLGVIALAGMIMRNAVILIDQIEQDHKSGHSHWDAVVEATVRRFRPIMLTAAAAVLAMIPLTRSNFWGPMAVAIMGGLLVATVLTLLFLPALYSAWFRIKRPEAQSGQ
jgi:multidrug efflux pump